jgi:hypothetical protein
MSKASGPKGLKKSKQLVIKLTAKYVGTTTTTLVTITKTDTMRIIELRQKISTQLTHETGSAVTIALLRAEDGTPYYDDSLVKV